MSSLWLIFSNGQRRGENRLFISGSLIFRFYLVQRIRICLECSDLKCFSHQSDPTALVNKNGGENKKILAANPSSVLRGNEEKLTLG